MLGLYSPILIITVDLGETEVGHKEEVSPPVGDLSLDHQEDQNGQQVIRGQGDGGT